MPEKSPVRSLNASVTYDPAFAVALRGRDQTFPTSRLHTDSPTTPPSTPSRHDAHHNYPDPSPRRPRSLR